VNRIIESLPQFIAYAEWIPISNEDNIWGKVTTIHLLCEMYSLLE